MLKVVIRLILITLTCKCRRGLESPFRKPKKGNSYNRYVKTSTRNNSSPSKGDKDKETCESSTYLQLKTVYEEDEGNYTSAKKKTSGKYTT